MIKVGDFVTIVWSDDTKLPNVKVKQVPNPNSKLWCLEYPNGKREITISPESPSLGFIIKDVD